MASSGMPTRLVNGASVSLQGKLEVKFRGFSTFLVLNTGRTYLADAGADEGTKRVRLIELRCDGHTSELFRHAGEMATARGKLFVEFAAPGPFNGVLLEQATVELPGGKVIQPVLESDAYVSPSLPAKLHRYLFTRTMIPSNLSDPPDTLVDTESGRSISGRIPGWCMMSAPQDFISCACAEGFWPVRGGLVQQSLPYSQWQSVPKPADIWKEMRAAQFSIPEGTRRPLHIQLVCERGAVPSTP